jgi:hypothetical protein
VDVVQIHPPPSTELADLGHLIEQLSLMIHPKQ